MVRFWFNNICNSVKVDSTFVNGKKTQVLANPIFMKDALNKIIGIGVTGDLTNYEARKIKLVNAIAMLMIVIPPISIPFFLRLNHPL